MLVNAKSVEGWQMSLMQLFGKTPKVTIVCGNCSYEFARRFDVSECKGQHPIAECPKCSAKNKLRIYM